MPTVLFERDNAAAAVFIRALRRVGVVAVSGVARHRKSQRPFAFRHKFGCGIKAVAVLVQLAALAEGLRCLLCRLNEVLHPCILEQAAAARLEMRALVGVEILLRGLLPRLAAVRNGGLIDLIAQRAEFRFVVPLEHTVVERASVVVDDAEIALRLVVVHRIGHAAVIRHDVRPLVEP